MAARIKAADGDAVVQAAGVLARGGLVAMPTETVYGLAADAANGEAVAGIFAAKGRPRFNPLIAHVDSIEMARRYGHFDALALQLAERFWPGPLTLVVPLVAGCALHPLVTAGQDTVALRWPRGFAARAVSALGRPVAAPSANVSGRISATSADDVERDLGSRIDLIVDGGPAEVGVESTILKPEGDTVRLLRPGGLAVGELEALGLTVIRTAPGAAIEAPGMLASHYAPGAGVRLNVVDVRPGEVLLAFGPHRAKGADKAVALLNLSPSGNLAEAAANLFSHLHALDRSGAAMIAVEPVPDDGLGEAINDRLARAAAPRGIPDGVEDKP